MPELLNNRYKILRHLSEGGENVVYVAADSQSSPPGQEVVIKRRKHSFEGSDKETWQRELRLVQGLHSTSIIRPIDSFIAPVETVLYGYVVQPFILGQTLAEELQSKRYTETEVTNIISELLEIVLFLQELRPPVLHRDLKPSNIMRRESDQSLVLIDFGTAIDHQQKTYGFTVGVGSYGYQAPEQLEGNPDLSSDIYSLGVIAIELLSRRRPSEMLWGGKLRWEQQLYGTSDPLKEWIRSAVASKEQRFSGASEAILALQAMSRSEKTAPQQQQQLQQEHHQAVPFSEVSVNTPIVPLMDRSSIVERIGDIISDMSQLSPLKQEKSNFWLRKLSEPAIPRKHRGKFIDGYDYYRWRRGLPPYDASPYNHQAENRESTVTVQTSQPTVAQPFASLQSKKMAAVTKRDLLKKLKYYRLMHVLMFFMGWSIFVIIPLTYTNTLITEVKSGNLSRAQRILPRIQRWGLIIIFGPVLCFFGLSMILAALMVLAA